MKRESSEAPRDSIEDVLDEALAQVLAPPPLPGDFRVGLDLAVARVAKRAPQPGRPSKLTHDYPIQVRSTAPAPNPALAKQVLTRSPRRSPYDDSISEFREHLAWARRLASTVFFAVIALFFSALIVLWYLVDHANSDAVSAVLGFLVAHLWWTFWIASAPVVLLFSVGNAVLNHISRTHDEMSTVDSKRSASLIAYNAGARARLVNHLLKVDRNPKLKRGESVADIERSRRTLRSLLKAIYDVALDARSSRQGPQGVAGSSSATGPRRALIQPFSWSGDTSPECEPDDSPKTVRLRARSLARVPSVGR